MYFSILASHTCHYKCQYMNSRPVNFTLKRKQTDHVRIIVAFDTYNDKVNDANYKVCKGYLLLEIKLLSDCKEEKEKKHSNLITQGKLLLLHSVLYTQHKHGSGVRVSRHLGAFYSSLTETISKQTKTNSIPVKQTILPSEYSRTSCSQSFLYGYNACSY